MSSTITPVPPHTHSFLFGPAPVCMTASVGPAPSACWQTPFEIGETAPRNAFLTGESEHIVGPHAPEPPCGPVFGYSYTLSVDAGGGINDLRRMRTSPHGDHTDYHVEAFAVFSFSPPVPELRGYVHGTMGAHYPVRNLRWGRAAILAGREEVPPTNTTEVGCLVMIANEDESHISMLVVLSQTPPEQIVASHIHAGNPGENGPPVFDLGPGTSWQSLGPGSARMLFEQPVPVELVQMVLAGQTYINVHTNLFPDGEVRGQIYQADPVGVAFPRGEPGLQGPSLAAPNPFSRSTTIRFALTGPTNVTLEVFDLAGRRVRTLLRDAVLQAGPNEMRWDGRDEGGQMVASGLYLYRLQVGGHFETGRLAVLR